MASRGSQCRSRPLVGVCDELWWYQAVPAVLRATTVYALASLLLGWGGPYIKDIRLQTEQNVGWAHLLLDYPRAVGESKVDLWKRGNELSELIVGQKLG